MRSKFFPILLSSTLSLSLISTAQANYYSLEEVTALTPSSFYYNREDVGQPEDFTFQSGTAQFYCGIERSENWYDLDGKMTDQGALNFYQGLALVEGEEGFFYLDTQGEQVGGIYQEAYPFYDDFALVCQEDRWFYIDQTGSVALRGLNFDFFGIFSDGLAMVGTETEEGMRYGFIDSSCRVVLPLDQEFAGLLSAKDREILRFSNNLAPFYDKESGLYGFQNSEGQVVIKADYSFVFAFEEGLAYVKSESFSGYVDHTGQRRINLGKYQGSSFQDGYALVDYSSNYFNNYNTKVVALIENPLEELEDASQTEDQVETQPEPEEPAIEEDVYQVETPSTEEIVPDVQEEHPPTPEEIPQEGTESEEITLPETGFAEVYSASILVNGEEVEFGAYMIDHRSYFKLTDLAYALQGTASSFAVSLDSNTGAIHLDFGGKYKETGSELEAAKMSQMVNLYRSPVYLNQDEISLPGYSIDGSGFFQLSSLISVLDLTVGWDQATGTVTIDTRVLG